MEDMASDSTLLASLHNMVSNCKKAYCVSSYVTLDEKLEVSRGRHGFRQYIASKPAQYGV